MPTENQGRRSKFFSFLSRVRPSDSTNVPPQTDKRGTQQKHRRAYSFSTRGKPLGEGRAGHEPTLSKLSISSPILRSPISLTGFDNNDIDSLASSIVGVHSGRPAGFTKSQPKFQRPYHKGGSGTSLQSSKSAVTRAGSRTYHLPFHSYSSHYEQQSDTPGSPYQNQGFARSGTTFSSNSRPQTPYDDIDDHELPLTAPPEFGEIGVAIGSEEELDGMISIGGLPQYSSLMPASQRSEPPRKPYPASYDLDFTPPPISQQLRQLVTGELYADAVLARSANSPLLSLLRLLRKKASAPISTVVTETTISLMYEILDLEYRIEITSELSSASDFELLLDFTLYLIEKGCLSNLVVQGANRKARRLMCKLMAKTPVIPKSIFMTGVDTKMSPSRIGMGGFGCVFEGEHQGKRVALKVLYKVRRDDDFVREALVWRSLSHQYLLPLLGIYEEQSLYFLVSPYMKNGTLAHWRTNQNPPPTEIEMRIREVAEGVWYIHSEGIVHGDLRGANILLDNNFHCQIADFGLARHSDITVTRSTTTLSFNFAAPELFGACSICNQSDEGDCPGCSNNGTQRPNKTLETDVYGFGCLYYQIYFDHIPFKGMGEAQIIRSVTAGKHPPRLHDPRLGDDAWSLIECCWAMEPTNRPTMADVLNAMRTPGRQSIWEAV